MRLKYLTGRLQNESQKMTDMSFVQSFTVSFMSGMNLHYSGRIVGQMFDYFVTIIRSERQ